jgi:lipid-A-disaccharide synthase-like uncharacterized protein
MVVFVEKVILMFVSLKSFVIVFTSLPEYVNMDHFSGGFLFCGKLLLLFWRCHVFGSLMTLIYDVCCCVVCVVCQIIYAF